MIKGLGKADLHIHTTASDGNSEAAQIVDLAAKNHLKTIAITDHDTIAGYEKAREHALAKGVTLLSGVELTTDFDGRECHLLAYCFDPEDPGFRKLLLSHKKARVDRGEWIIDQLAGKGLDLDINEVKAEANGSNIGRPHIASVLVDKGYVATQREAFIRYLSNDALGPIDSNYRSYNEVISVVKEAGGAVVVAHPGKMYTEEELEKFVDAGIDGIEVLHPSHDYKTQKQMEGFADRHNLLKTGGSDFHGDSSGYQKHFGIVTISESTVDRLVHMTGQRKEISLDSI